MAESSTPVRLFQQHLRESGLLMAAGQFDAAASHLDAALAIDPASLAALALREKLTALRASYGRSPEENGARAYAPAPAPAPAEPVPPAAPAGRFVPHGVDAASWTDFEHRVQQRRFRALIEAGERAVAAGNLTAARSALEEARELQPESLEVARLSIRLAAMPTSAERARTEGLLRSRTFRAASLLLLGVSLLMGLDWVRSDQAGTQAANLAAIGTGGEVEGPTVAVQEDQATLFTPTGTEESASPAEPPRVANSDAAPVAPVPAPVTPRAAAVRELPAGETSDTYVTPANRLASGAVTTVPRVGGEIPDNYVAPPRRTQGDARDASAVTPAGRGTPAAIANIARQPVPVVETLVGAPGVIASTPVPVPTVSSAPVAPVAAGAAAGAAAVVPTVNERARVESVLQQYARAYGRLDASAVRAVWPTVDERALAKAFSNLSSQTVSFDRCDVEVESGASSATASCHGKASYVGKVGSQEQRTESRTVRFELKRDGEAWKIHKAQTGR